MRGGYRARAFAGASVLLVLLVSLIVPIPGARSALGSGWFNSSAVAAVTPSTGLAQGSTGNATTPGGASSAGAAASRAVVAKGPDSLRLLSQSTWVGPGASEFRIDLAVTASDPSNEAIAVDVYPELITRSEFQLVLAGNFPEPYYQNPPVPLTQLQAGPDGGAQLVIPVNSPDGGLPIATTTAGVYPVQVFLTKEGLTQGKPLTTFLVYAASGAASMKHLGVALVVPVQAKVPLSSSGAVGQVPAASATVLEGDAVDVASYRAPVTLEISGSTLEAMSRGTSQERDAVSQLRESVAAGDELLPATALPVDLGSLVGSGLNSELQRQLSSGQATTLSLLGEAPSYNTWAFSGQVSASTLRTLAEFGLDEVTVPEATLSTLPLEYQRLTFAQPSKLDIGGEEVEVLGADAELSRRIAEASSPGQAVLVANQVLAELAMIDLEAPNDSRGVVLMPQAMVAINPTFLAVLLSGLQGNPLLQAMTVSQEFASVPLATSSGTQALVRQLQGGRSEPLAGSGQLDNALGAVADSAAVYGQVSRFVTGLEHELFVSTSSVWSAGERAGIIAEVQASAEAELHKLRLPPPVSITLTSRHGRLPLTMLSSAGVSAHVRLVLQSEELSFVAAKFPAGTCTPVNTGSESCDLKLAGPATTLQVPVEVRTPGAFQLTLEIQTPNGALVTQGTDTIRSTAASGTGLIVMVCAALFLAVWWVRNARHGRRARRLVPRPGEDAGNEAQAGSEAVVVPPAGAGRPQA